jgi:predicted metal-binding membrane protein
MSETVSAPSARVARYARGKVVLLVVGAGLLAATAASWVSVIRSSASMEMDMTPTAGAYLTAWTVMMAAMMLPSVAPFALLYARGAPTAIAPGILAAGYLGVWALVGIPAYALDRAVGMEHPTATAAVLITAGVYQLSPVKEACLRRCRSPADFLVQHWRPGLGGAFRLGFEHGAFCLGCCIALMAVLVVAGGMGLVWVISIAAVVAAEKLLPHGLLLGRIGGIGLVAAGIAVAR